MTPQRAPPGAPQGVGCSEYCRTLDDSTRLRLLLLQVKAAFTACVPEFPWCLPSVALAASQRHENTSTSGRAACRAPSSSPHFPAPASAHAGSLCRASRKVACTFRSQEGRAFVRIYSSLCLRIHLKLPEHLLSTFVYAVDLILDLSYLIK